LKLSLPVKLYIIVSNLGRGGAEKQLVLLLKNYDPKEVNVRVLSLSRKDEEYWSEKIRKLGIRLSGLPAKHSQFRRFRKIGSTIASWRPDIVWAWHFFTGVYALPFVLFRKTRRLVVGLRNDGDYILSVFPWAPLLLWLADAAVGNSHVVFEQLAAKGIKPRRKYVLPNIVEVTERPAMITRSVGRIGYCGNIHPRKGLDIFVRAAKILVESGYDGDFVIAGKGEKGALLHCAEELNIASRLKVFDEVDCASFMRQFDIFVLPSRHEGCPNVLLEALGNGIPCVVTQLGGVKEIMTNGENVLMVGREDPQSLAAALMRLKNDFKLRRRFSKNGIRLVRKENDAKLIATKLWLDIVRSVISYGDE
jgi:glycosyltransferase involved in cell wall biosynthesis